MPIWILCLDVWSSDADLRLIGRIHRIRCEVFGEPVKQQVQRMRRIPLSQIEHQRVWFRESGKVQQFESGDVAVIVRKQRWKHVATSVVPRPGRSIWMLRGNDLEFGKRGSRHEALVREYLGVGWVLDSYQPRLIKIVDLFHRLRRGEAQPALARLHAGSIYLDVLVRIWQITFIRTYPMTDNCRSNHVGDELVPAAIPGKQNGTRASTAIYFQHLVRLVRSKLDLVLIYAGRPQQAHDIGTNLLSKSREDLRRALRKMSAAARDLPFLLRLACKHLHLGAEGALVIVQAFQG